MARIPTTPEELIDVEQYLADSVERVRIAVAFMRKNSMETAQLNIDSARNHYAPNIRNWALQLLPDLEKDLAAKKQGIPSPFERNRLKNQRAANRKKAKATP